MNIGEVVLIISFILLIGFIIFGLTLERLTHRRRKKRKINEEKSDEKWLKNK